MEKSIVHEVHFLKLLDQVSAILRIVAGLVTQVYYAHSGLPSACDELQNCVDHRG